jgi:hemolysin III
MSDVEPAPRAVLYDSHRGVHYAKPLWRGWSHLAWFELSLVAGTLLIVAAHGAVETAVIALYAACISGLFGVSGLYHRGNWGPSATSILQRLDHMMIFFVIAGTATPSFILGSPVTYGLVCVIVMWAITLTATTIRMFRMQAPEVIVGGAFIGLGCIGVLALPGVWTTGGVAAGILMIVGGLLYVTGAVLFHRRWPNYAPEVFGYHEYFHAWVCAGATCQYIATALLIR